MSVEFLGRHFNLFPLTGHGLVVECLNNWGFKVGKPFIILYSIPFTERLGIVCRMNSLHTVGIQHERINKSA